MPEPATTELIAVRHGETTWNASGRMQGHVPGELSETGVRQAEAIAACLKEVGFDVLYTSDLKRAFDTAAAIAKVTEHEIHQDVRLRERHLGVFQGLTNEECQQRFPEDFAKMNAFDPDHTIPEGESARQVFERVAECAEEIVARHPGQRIVAVTHGGVLDRLLRYALEIPLEAPRKYKLYNASINRFLIQDGFWKLAQWGEIRHLKGMNTIDDW